MGETRATSDFTFAGDSANDGAEGSAQAPACAEGGPGSDLTELDTEEGEVYNTEEDEICERKATEKEEEEEDEDGQGAWWVSERAVVRGRTMRRRRASKKAVEVYEEEVAAEGEEEEPEGQGP